MEDISISRLDKLKNFIIGDPGLVRSLIVNIFYGVNDYRTDTDPVQIQIRSLKESTSQVRLEFAFKVSTINGIALVDHVRSLQQGNTHSGSNLTNAFTLLLESEGTLSAVPENQGASLSFFQDFTRIQPKLRLLRQTPAWRLLSQESRELPLRMPRSSWWRII